MNTEPPQGVSIEVGERVGDAYVTRRHTLGTGQVHLTVHGDDGRDLSITVPAGSADPQTIAAAIEAAQKAQKPPVGPDQ